MSLLEQLRQLTTVVADTGDLEAIRALRPVDATTNPSLITAAARLPAAQPLLAQALQQARSEGHQDRALTERAIDLLTVRLGVDILGVIEGRVSTEVDARLSHDAAATIAKAHELIDLYAQAGIGRERVLIKIASTWAGIQAAQVLEQQGIACNLTLLFGLHQARACAEAGVTLISPFVGRILDWQKRHEGRAQIPVDEDAGVLSVRAIYQYYKQHGYPTQVMGASFRSAEQIIALAGCDLLTIAPALLDELAQRQGGLVRQLHPDTTGPAARPQPLTEAEFTAQLQADTMAAELLAAGIEGFIKARDQLTEQLENQAILA